MKKSIFAFIAVFMIMNYGKAQQSSFGITAGATFASYKISSGSYSVTSKTKTGFTLGITSSVPMGKSFSFQPALNYVQKGGKIKEGDFSGKSTFNYLELPLNFVYTAHATKGAFFVGAGPSLSMGLSGKDESNGESTDIKFGSGENDDLKAFEAGINVLTGYQFKGGFLVVANYNAGLSNVAVTTEGDDSKAHNRYFGIRLGYMFANKKK